MAHGMPYGARGVNDGHTKRVIENPLFLAILNLLD
tara:strand:- start:215 stop:319 length:105 start_codon:yes stop_codon:yes gene_type:complete